MWVGRIGLPIIAAMLTVSFLPGLMATWPTPNLVLAGVIYLILAHRFTDALAWAVAGGLVLDATLPAGVFYLPFLVGFVGLGLLLKQRFGLQPPALVAVGFILASIGSLVSAEAIRTGTGWGSHQVWQAVVNAAGLAGISLITYTFAGRKRRLAIEVQ